MQNTTYYCDICGKEFPPSKLDAAHLFGYNMDFCEGCKKDLKIKFDDLREAKRNGN